MISAERAASPALRLAPVGLLALLIYFVAIGGTSSGEIVTAFRAVSAGVGAVLIAAYVLLLPRQADRIDKAILTAVLLFALAGVLSQFPRQSLDAVLAAFAYAAAFFLARGALGQEHIRTMLERVLIGLSLAFTILAVVAWTPLFLRWLAITEWAVFPPLNLELNTSRWGHRYDLVLLIALAYPAWWTGNPSRARQIAAVIVGLLGLAVVVMTGSRAIWLAIAVATVALAAGPAIRLLRSRPMAWLVPAVLLVAMAALAVLGVFDPLIGRLTSSASLGFRAAMWQPLAELWLANPLAGVGPGAFPWALQLTPYFETNSYAPRHPDNPLFQLLPEAGLLGVAAAGLVSATILISVLRGRSSAARWAIVAFFVACIGMNPTDFVFLVVVALAWAAYAAPRVKADSPSEAAPRRRWILVASLVLLAIISISQISGLVGAIAYDRARVSAEQGDIDQAHEALDTAVTADPGMALYWRQRGIASYLLGDADAALSDLERAVDINAVDDVTWRVMALVAQDEPELAERAISTALSLRRSNAANLLLAASLSARSGQDATATSVLREIVQAWPTVTGARGWSELSEEETFSLVEQAAEAWSRGEPSPNPLLFQEDWLAAVAGQPELPDRAGLLSPELESAWIAALRCEPTATDLLGRVSPAEQRSPIYWQARVRAAANRGEVDQDAIEMLGILDGTGNEEPALGDGTLNPLNEGRWWGYRRFPIFWPSAGLDLPDPIQGELRWMQRPAEAVAEAGLEEDLPNCAVDS